MHEHSQSRTVLFVEDSNEDFEAFRRVLGKLQVANPVHRCKDGDDCLEYLNRTGRYEEMIDPLPALIFLDLNLPGTDGRQTLRAIKQDSRLCLIPVNILTTSSNPRDVQTCYEYGANAYTLKPLDHKELIVKMRIVLDFWLGVTVLP